MLRSFLVDPESKLAQIPRGAVDARLLDQQVAPLLTERQASRASP